MVETKGYETLIAAYEMTVSNSDGTAFNGLYSLNMFAGTDGAIAVTLTGDDLPEVLIIDGQYKNEKIHLELKCKEQS